MADQVPMMDRPAYELVRLLEGLLDDGDQVRDTPFRPNTITIWGIRALLEPYGGKAHRWQWPHCFDCGHQSPNHSYGSCDLCGCVRTPEEVVNAAPDETLDDDVMSALRWDQENGS